MLCPQTRQVAPAGKKPASKGKDKKLQRKAVGGCGTADAVHQRSRVFAASPQC